MSSFDYPRDDSLHVRRATLEDLEDISSVAREAFPDDPEYDYRFPARKEYPDDHKDWITEEYKEYLSQEEKYIVVIATSTENDGRAVSLSVWDKAVHLPHRGGDLGVPDDAQLPAKRRDVDADHFRAFKRDMEKNFQIFFGQYGKKQIHLWLLCTHPAFRRRGAATRLCRWGLDYAHAQALQTTVLASPMGKHLYQELGFDLRDSFFVGAADEKDQRLTIWALEYLLEKTSRADQQLGLLSRCWQKIWRFLMGLGKSQESPRNLPRYEKEYISGSRNF